MAEGTQASALDITMPEGAATELTVGESMALSAVVSPAEASGATIRWTSDPEDCAAVDASGLVTAKAAGEVSITATADDGSGVSGTLLLTIRPPPLCR